MAKIKKHERSVGIALLPLGNDATFDQLVKFVNQHRDELFLILIGGEISASAYKRLIRSGAADWTSAKSDLNEVLDIIARRRYVDDAELWAATWSWSSPGYGLVYSERWRGRQHDARHRSCSLP